jgi:hypothetical protein
MPLKANKTKKQSLRLLYYIFTSEGTGVEREEI